MTAEQTPIVQMYKIAPHDVRCLGNSLSAGSEDFSLPRKALAGVWVAETKSDIPASGKIISI